MRELFFNNRGWQKIFACKPYQRTPCLTYLYGIYTVYMFVYLVISDTEDNRIWGWRAECLLASQVQRFFLWALVGGWGCSRAKPGRGAPPSPLPLGKRPSRLQLLLLLLFSISFSRAALLTCLLTSPLHQLGSPRQLKHGCGVAASFPGAPALRTAALHTGGSQSCQSKPGPPVRRIQTLRRSWM